MSELFAALEIVRPYLKGAVVDIGCGQVRVTPGAVGVDFKRHYDKTDADDFAPETDAHFPCGWERFVAFCEAAGAVFDTVFSSHLLEDYEEAYDVLERWLGIVRVGGNVVLVLPIEHIYRTQAPLHPNEAHEQDWLGAEDFLAKMPVHLAQRLIVLHQQDGIGRHSFVIVLRREA
jgi:predicted SAM-dependent methyltransferase